MPGGEGGGSGKEVGKFFFLFLMVGRYLMGGERISLSAVQGKPD